MLEQAKATQTLICNCGARATNVIALAIATLEYIENKSNVKVKIDAHQNLQMFLKSF